jgi:starvation-inducible DNA-binding protein
MKPGIADKNREAVVGVLNTLLADESILSTKTRNYHWNIVGSRSNNLHTFFERQYEELNHVVDYVAERARTLGGSAMGTLAEFVQQARLKERAAARLDAQEMIVDLLADHEAVVRQLRDDLEATAKRGDAGTSELLTGLKERHEEMAWMLRAFLGS